MRNVIFGKIDSKSLWWILQLFLSPLLHRLLVYLYFRATNETAVSDCGKIAFWTAILDIISQTIYFAIEPPIICWYYVSLRVSCVWNIVKMFNLNYFQFVMMMAIQGTKARLNILVSIRAESFFSFQFQSKTKWNDAE